MPFSKKPESGHPAVSAPPFDYESFLRSPAHRQWKRIGIRRRAGITVPLFSIYTRRSTGIGEIPDLQKMADWCRLVNAGMLQLLPLNDTGFDFRPYDAKTSFGLDPVHLSLKALTGVPERKYRGAVAALRKKFPLAGRKHVDYGIKRAKLELLRRIFDDLDHPGGPAFEAFREKSRYWLRDYARFMVLQEHHQSSWESWPEPLRQHREDALRETDEKFSRNIFFREWLQWQLYEQMRAVQEYAEKQDVLMMGDLPYLVSRDSADVWAHQELFKLDGLAGAPPDSYNAMGQRWGMPTYRWEEIEKQNYEYWARRFQYAENFSQ